MAQIRWFLFLSLLLLPCHLRPCHLLAECHKDPKAPPRAFVLRPGRSCCPLTTCRVHLTEVNVPRLEAEDLAPAAEKYKLPLLKACPFLTLWPDHKFVSALVRRKLGGKAHTIHSLSGLTTIYDTERAGPALYSLFAWKRRPTQKEAARLVRIIINSFQNHYVSRRELLPLERALATKLPTGERFPIRFRLNPLQVKEEKDLGWVITAEAIVYDRKLAGIYRYSFELLEGVGTVDITPLVNADTGEVLAFREIVDSHLGIKRYMVEHH